MPLRPNRLSYWLPLLLFGWATPNLSAQTWTTVWTPNSAPAARAGTGSTNRDYRTNCYPCKVWDNYKDSGKGGWEYFPPGTEPIQCNGNTTNYACKVCNGGEGVQDKSNDTDCDAGGGKPGKCCDGNCYEYPTDPCGWAATHQTQFSQQAQIEVFGDTNCYGSLLSG